MVAGDLDCDAVPILEASCGTIGETQSFPWDIDTNVRTGLGTVTVDFARFHGRRW
jgi:hypothetical protein